MLIAYQALNYYQNAFDLLVDEVEVVLVVALVDEVELEVEVLVVDVEAINRKIIMY